MTLRPIKITDKKKKKGWSHNCFFRAFKNTAAHDLTSVLGRMAYFLEFPQLYI